MRDAAGDRAVADLSAGGGDARREEGRITADLSAHITRGKAAQVISTLLGISSGTCKVYLSDHEQSLNRKYHQEEIERLNSLLAELGSDISI